VNQVDFESMDKSSINKSCHSSINNCSALDSHKFEAIKENSHKSNGKLKLDQCEKKLDNENLKVLDILRLKGSHPLQKLESELTTCNWKSTKRCLIESLQNEIKMANKVMCYNELYNNMEILPTSIFITFELLQASIAYTAINLCEKEAKKRISLIEKALEICNFVENKLVSKKENVDTMTSKFTLLDYVSCSKNYIPNNFMKTVIGDVLKGS